MKKRTGDKVVSSVEPLQKIRWQAQLMGGCKVYCSQLTGNIKMLRGSSGSKNSEMGTRQGKYK